MQLHKPLSQIEDVTPCPKTATINISINMLGLNFFCLRPIASRKQRRSSE
jgi:hypothetical protein